MDFVFAIFKDNFDSANGFVYLELTLDGDWHDFGKSCPPFKNKRTQY